MFRRRCVGVLGAACGLAACAAVDSSTEGGARTAWGTGWGEPGRGNLEVRFTEPPRGGDVRLILFESSDGFDTLRAAVKSLTAPADGRDVYVLSDVPPGDYALLAHHDENGDGALDRNFIGIPIEPIAFSNGYRPLGPPSFDKARFTMGAKGESFELTLERPLGERGLFTVGVGGIWQSSPYVDYDGGVFQPIPAITYIGDRFQILGPNVQVRLFGTDRLRLGATARYRIGAYEEDESDALQGLGDRDDTLMAGLSLRYDIPRNFELQIGYEHDALDRIRGGEARVLLARPFQIDVARLSPRIGFRWLDSDLADYDFGVPSNAARPGRPAYSPGGSLNLEVGLGAFIEITRNWRLILDLGVQFLDSDLQDSPIVDEDVLLQGFAALSYAF